MEEIKTDFTILRRIFVDVGEAVDGQYLQLNPDLVKDSKDQILEFGNEADQTAPIIELA
jgi:hypothetical protein